MPQNRFYGWKLLFVFWAIIILNFAFPTFGTSVVNTYMAKAMHLNRKELGLAFSVFSLMAGLPGPLVAKSIYKFGIRFTLVVGTLLASIGSLMMALFVHTVFQAIVVFGFVVGSGAAMAGTIAPQVGMARWFHKKRARAISLLLTASGIGGFIAVPSLNGVIARFGGNWRAAWWCMAVMSLVAALIAALFVKESPAQMGQAPDGEPATDAAASSATSDSKKSGSVFKTTEDWTLREALSTPTVWLLIATYLGFFMGFFIYIAHGISHLEGLGYAPGAAAKSISIIMISSLIGQFAVAALGDRIEPRYLSAVAVCLYGAGMLLAIKAVEPAAMYSYAILMGSGFGAAFTCLQTTLGNYYGTKVYPALLGVTTPFGTILGAIGPVTAGYVYDRYGTYSYVFSGVAAICFASAVLYLLAKPPVRRIRST
ncbi:MAG TPA: MFS transporter [Candidatus Acidoferrales bacterium]|nr:MFS transporter [Candidatus Acidoferrales bacterium]